MSLNQKQSFYNTKSFLKSYNLLHNAIKNLDTNKDKISHHYSFEANTKTFYIENQDKFFNNSKCFTKSNHAFDDVRIQPNKEPNDLPNSEIHLVRKKSCCLIVVGDELSYGETNNNLEKRLENSFAIHCAKKLDTDLVMTTIKNINNTSAFFRLIDILNYLKKFEYKEIKIIFQMTDFVKCLKTDLFHFPFLQQKNFTKNLHFDKNFSAYKNHLFYNFFSPIQYFYFAAIFPNDLDLFIDSNILKDKDKVSLYDFFELYESFFYDLLTSLQQSFKEHFEINFLIWKDYNPPINKNFVDVCWLDLILKKENQKVLLPYTFDVSWLKEFYRVEFEEIVLPKENNKKIVVVEAFESDYFDDPEEFEFPNDDQNVVSYLLSYKSSFNANLKKDIEQEESKINETNNVVQQYKSFLFDQKEWANYLLKQSGWIK